MTHFIPRAKMPQVDEADLPHMLSDANDSRGWHFDIVEAGAVLRHQYVKHDRALNMPQEVAMKPIIISADNVVVDGNHRAYYDEHMHGERSKMLVIRLAFNFEEALDWLLEQPYTYTINPHTHERN